MERTGRRPKDTPVYFYAQLSKPMDEIVSWREGGWNLTVIRKEYRVRMPVWQFGLKQETTKSNAESRDFVCQCRTGT